jgi:ACR3 family arsenite efflux pump ArsB
MATDEHEDILNKIKAWAVPGLGSVVLLLLTIQGNNAIKRMDDVTERMNQMVTKYEVSNAQVGFLLERVKNLEEAKKDAAQVHSQLEIRTSSLEQRAALADQYMQTHK